MSRMPLRPVMGLGTMMKSTSVELMLPAFDVVAAHLVQHEGIHASVAPQAVKLQYCRS
jgi:hypothetical protein